MLATPRISAALSSQFRIVIVPEMLRFLNDYRMLIFGALMVFMMIFKPEGFWGAGKRRRNIYKINSEVPDHGSNS